jgi:hypothetical protein
LADLEAELRNRDLAFGIPDPPDEEGVATAVLDILDYVPPGVSDQEVRAVLARASRIAAKRLLGGGDV